jgi:hypothetical protein
MAKPNIKAASTGPTREKGVENPPKTLRVRAPFPFVIYHPLYICLIIDNGNISLFWRQA